MARKLSKQNRFWRRGDLTRLSYLTGIRLPALSGFFHRKIGVSSRRALRLQGAIHEITGKQIPFLELLFSKKSQHPCFF